MTDEKQLVQSDDFETFKNLKLSLWMFKFFNQAFSIIIAIKYVNFSPILESSVTVKYSKAR